MSSSKSKGMKKGKPKARASTYEARRGAVPTGDLHLSLRGYNQQQVPDCTLIKMTYSDYRTLTAAVNQANYVYKFNSCFDPDFTGVGGQPDGFDQWKTLYQQYRVMACHLHLEACSLAGAALVTAVPTPSSTVSSSAEENVGLRRAKGKLTAVSGAKAVINMMMRPSDVFGVPDSSVLTNDNYASSITGSPSSAAYVRIEAETSGASDALVIFVVLTMYVRFEKPFDTIDTLARRRRLLGLPEFPQVTAGASELPASAAAAAPPVLSSEALQEVRRALGALQNVVSVVPGL